MEQITFLSIKYHQPFHHISTMEANWNLSLHILQKNISKITSSSSIHRIHHIRKQCNGFIQHKSFKIIISSKWLNLSSIDKRIEKDLDNYQNPKISNKARQETAIFCLHLQELSKNIQNQSIDCLYYKKIHLISLESDCLQKELGELSCLMLAFRLIGMEFFVELNLIIKRFGSCYSKRLGLKSMDLMIIFMQVITMKG